MVENNKKSTKYWENLVEKGEIESQINLKLENLRLDYCKKLVSENINYNESRLVIEEIGKRIDFILAKHNTLTDRERQQKKNIFKLKFEENFRLVSKKKAYCKISFLAYPLYKFLIAFSSIIDEAIFRVKNNGLSTVCVDKSRESLVRLEIKNKDYLFLRDGEIGINLNDLASIMKCNASDDSTAELIFGENIIYITIMSKKFNSVIKRTLSTIDLEAEDISMENFKKIQFFSHFSLSKDKVNYLIKNSELYSQNIQIRVDEKRVCFKENNKMGQGKIIWEKDNLELLFIDFVAIQNELANQNLDESEIKILEGIISKRECCSCHPGSFLIHIGKVSNILNKNELINFQLREGSPLKIIVNIRSLGDTLVFFFVVPESEE